MDLHRTADLPVHVGPRPCGYIRHWLRAAGCVSLLAASAPAGAQNKITIGGAGSMVPVRQELARADEAKSGAQAIEIMTNRLGSGGGIKATEAGRPTIGLTGRELKQAEKGSLVYRQLALMPVIVAATTYDTVLKSQAHIKALSLDGVQPTPEAVASGKYRLAKQYAAVTRGEPQGTAKAFLDFIASAAGQKIMAGAGLVPRR